MSSYQNRRYGRRGGNGRGNNGGRRGGQHSSEGLMVLLMLIGGIFLLGYLTGMLGHTSVHESIGFIRY